MGTEPQTKKQLSELRESHTSFYYQAYNWEITDQGLLLTFSYFIDPDIQFTHQVVILAVTAEQVDQINEQELKQYIFNIGMVEALSYWKTTCAEEIIVECSTLTLSQVDWWTSLLIKGMGEYFYVNAIDFTSPNFVSIKAKENSTRPATAGVLTHANKKDTQSNTAARMLIPIGGGKDSLVTLELLKKYARSEHGRGLELGLFMANAPQSSLDICALSGVDALTATRIFDEQLFALNQDGYLNGHVPVSASIAFISLLTARIWGYTHVAISNEHSSNEGNVLFKGHTINHQYSKTYEFERLFQEYVAETFGQFGHVPLYFSFVRPLYELQIARLFTKHCERYLMIFHSCNRGQKSNVWCGECPKCLFAYAILFPWLSEETMVRIFGKNMFDDDTLLPLSLELLGRTKQKPFECVGTVEETEVAFGLCLAKYDKKTTIADGGGELVLPKLLSVLKNEKSVLPLSLEGQEATNILNSFNHRHSVPDWLATFLENCLR